MERTFVIAWKSKSEPRWGQGKKLFTREEAEALANEMNLDYPAFVHEPLNLAATESVADTTLAPAPEPVLEPAIIHVDFQPETAEFAVEPTSQEAVLA